MTALVVQGDARNLPLPDASVDCLITSPPYFALRSYTDAGVHFPGQIGSEQTPAEYLDALWACTAEWMRVLKPEGSIFVNLGDKYAQNEERSRNGNGNRQKVENVRTSVLGPTISLGRKDNGTTRTKSLMGIPWRYAIGCIDTTRTGYVHVQAVRRIMDEVASGELDIHDAHRFLDELEAQAAQGSAGLGLILRAEIIWSKPNGLPESVTDRVRRSHEQWFHFVKQPRYYAAVDEIREAQSGTHPRRKDAHLSPKNAAGINGGIRSQGGYFGDTTFNPLGKLPGSVWTVPSEPLQVPDHVGVDHFAAFPTEWPRRLILGWSPPGICTACGQGRRPVMAKTGDRGRRPGGANTYTIIHQGKKKQNGLSDAAAEPVTITGYACACPQPDAPTRPAVILDPFGGTGTTALVAHALGRVGITVDMSGDYSRLARWRTTNQGELAKAMRVPKPAPVPDGQMEMFA